MYTTFMLLMVIIIQVVAQNLCYNNAITAKYCDASRQCCHSDTRCCYSSFSSYSTSLKTGHVCEETLTDVYYCEEDSYCCLNNKCCSNSGSGSRGNSGNILSSSSTGAIAGIVIGSLFGFGLLVVICIVICSKCNKASTQVTPVQMQYPTGDAPVDNSAYPVRY